MIVFLFEFIEQQLLHWVELSLQLKVSATAEHRLWRILANESVIFLGHNNDNGHHFSLKVERDLVGLGKLGD